MQIVDKDIRQQILDATQRTVYGRGVSALRMDELAQDLGMSKKTLYLYFRSKEELLEAMFEAKHARQSQQMQAVLADKTVDFLGRLKNVMRVGWQVSSELSAAVIQDMQRSAPQLWARQEQFRDEQVLKTFRQLLTEGQELGLLREDLRVDIVLDMLLSAVAYSLSPNALYQKEYSVQEAHNTFFVLMFEGILNDKARRAL